MNNYRELVERLAKTNSSERIPNATIDHATVLIENLFAHAHEKVRILSGQLNKDVYGASEILGKARTFLRGECGVSNEGKKRLEILLQEPQLDIGENPLVRMCKEEPEFSNICEVKCISDAKDREISCHFIVADGKAWRFEPDKRTPAAIACFNEPEIGKQLDEMFDVLFGRGTPLTSSEQNVSSK